MYSLVISYSFFFSFENIISAKLVLICSINLNDTKIELIKRLLVSNDLDAGNADAALGVPVSSEPHAWLSIGISWDWISQEPALSPAGLILTAVYSWTQNQCTKLRILCSLFSTLWICWPWKSLLVSWSWRSLAQHFSFKVILYWINGIIFLWWGLRREREGVPESFWRVHVISCSEGRICFT